MFRSKTMISLYILLGTSLGWFLAHEYLTNQLLEWQEKPVIDNHDQAFCFWLIYGSALLATLVASWKERTSLWLSLTGITVGWFIFSLLAGPASSFSPTATQQGLLPAEVIREQLNRQTFGMLLGAFLCLYWPEIGRFLNSLNGKHSAALTAPRSPSESHGSS